MRRVAFSREWLPRHALLAAALVVLWFLGKWQWDVSGSQRGTLQNLFYAFNWWGFGVFFLIGWWRSMRAEVGGLPPAPRYIPEGTVLPQQTGEALVRTTQSPDEDPELAAYNAWLARLNSRPATPSRTEPEPR